jgi:histone deacetylase 6
MLSFSTALFFLFYVTFLSRSKNDMQVEGMQKPCSGSVNKTLPYQILWKTFPCHIFFGRDSSHSWGPGGVAFLNPERNSQHKTYMCMHKIS